ncbi:MAG TPA: hypothetical protein VGV92_06550 [Gammaproteobacteria bacterium]|nr:hypothetical protein [Gammaproteobacteria bacterium]
MEEVSDLLSSSSDVLGLIGSYLSGDDLLNFAQAHRKLMRAVTRTQAENLQNLIQPLGDQLVKLLRRNKSNLSSDEVESIWRLHQFYELCGGKAPLTLIKQKADELNKRANRQEKLDGCVAYASEGVCGSMCWGVFGIALTASSACCGCNPGVLKVGLSITGASAGSAGLCGALKYEAAHNTFRGKFCDVQYDLEAHPANDFHSVLPPEVQMDAAQEEVQPMLVEQEQEPSCFSGVANFFRTRMRITPAENGQEMAVIFNP